MSTTTEITIWCDHENAMGRCVEWVTVNNYESNGGKIRPARVTAARDYGWSYEAQKDLCPKHRTERQHQRTTPEPTVTLAQVEKMSQKQPIA